MRNWLMRFMAGRNGADAFARFLSIAALVILILSMLIPGYVGTALWVLALGCLIYSYFRIFSKNTAKRYTENAKYLSIKYKITGWFRRKKSAFSRARPTGFTVARNAASPRASQRARGRSKLHAPNAAIPLSVKAERGARCSVMLSPTRLGFRSSSLRVTARFTAGFAGHSARAAASWAA